MSRMLLSVGSRVRYEGEAYEVVAMTARVVTLRALFDAVLAQVALVQLLGSEGVQLLDAPQAPPAIPGGVLLERVPQHELERAQWRYRHLLEATTGYSTGDSAGALEHEPRPEYDPRRIPSLRRRFAAKACEMRSERPGETISERTLYSWKAMAIDQHLGLLGMCDARYRRIEDPFRGVAPEVIEALGDVLREHVDLSTVTRAKIRHEVSRLVRERHGERVRLPGRSRFYEVYAARTRQTGANREASYRRGAGRRQAPSKLPLRAARSGELLLLDSTVVDLLVIDRRSGRLVRPEITVGIDGFDKSLRCARVVAEGTRGVDAAFLLYDALRPEPWQPAWPLEAQWNFSGVPRRIVVMAGGAHLPDGIPAALPFGAPTSVVVDHGRIFLSAAFFAGCAEFGISVLPAPPGRPSYKGIVEQFFDSANALLWERLPGHTGRNAAHRGRSAEAKAAIFLDELRDLLVEWAITVYHQREHEGCRLPHAPQKAVTPNIAFEYSLAETGFISAVPRPEQVVRLLPVEWRRINAGEVKLAGLKYWAEVLAKWMPEKSPYGKGNRWPFHVDPRDLSRIWFQDPDDRSWHALHRLGARHPGAAFSDAGLAWTKRLMAEEGLDIRNEDATNDALDAFLERNRLRLPRNERELRVLDRMSNDTLRARDDQVVFDGLPGESSVERTLLLPAGFAPAEREVVSLSDGLQQLAAVPPTDDGALAAEDAEDGLDELLEDAEPLDLLQ